MAVRRVVTGHTAEGVAIVVSDEQVPAIPIGEAGSASTLVWNREQPGRFPDDGSQPEFAGIFPPPGGCNIAVMELARRATTSTSSSVSRSSHGRIPTNRECTAPRRWTTTSS